MQGLDNEVLSRTEMGIVIASHDINLITRFCDRILLLSKGRIIGYGRQEDVVTEESKRKVFGIGVEIVHSHGVPYMLPTGSTGFELRRRTSCDHAAGSTREQPPHHGTWVAADNRKTRYQHILNR